MSGAATARASARWTPDYEYVCSKGHALGADAPVERCPAVLHGSPCPGELVRVGKGSRSTGEEPGPRDAGDD